MIGKEGAPISFTAQEKELMDEPVVRNNQP